MGQPVTDPGELICKHEHRTHYLGGGIHVCFACWLTLLLGVTPKKETRRG